MRTSIKCTYVRKIAEKNDGKQKKNETISNANRFDRKFMPQSQHTKLLASNGARKTEVLCVYPSAFHMNEIGHARYKAIKNCMLLSDLIVITNKLENYYNHNNSSSSSGGKNQAKSINSLVCTHFIFHNLLVLWCFGGVFSATNVWRCLILLVKIANGASKIKPTKLEPKTRELSNVHWAEKSVNGHGQINTIRLLEMLKQKSQRWHHWMCRPWMQCAKWFGMEKWTSVSKVWCSVVCCLHTGMN